MHHLSTHLLLLRLAGEEKPQPTSQPLLLRHTLGRLEMEPSCDNHDDRPPHLSDPNKAELADSSEYS